MEQKIKIKDAANELGVEISELVAITKEYFGIEKKSGGTLTPDEINVALEKILFQKVSDNITEYFESKPKPKTEKPEKQESQEKQERQERQGKQENSESREKPEKPKHPAKPKPFVKHPANKLSEAFKQPEKPKLPDRPPRPVAKPKVEHKFKPQQETKAPIPQKPYAGDTGTQRRNFDKTHETREMRETREPRPFVAKEENLQKPPKKKLTPKPVKAAVDINKLKVNDPPKAKQKGEAVQRGEQIVKRVDTRGNYVELDRYNEKYESIAAQQATQQRNQHQNSGRGPTNFRGRQKFGNQRGTHQRRNMPPVRRKETEAEKLLRLELEKARNKQLEVLIPDNIVISELAARLKVKASVVIKKLFNLGIMANQNQTVDYDTAALISDELGAKIEREVIITVEERLFEDVEDTAENLRPRSPVVVVMGHVDHGKTSLLDSIRNSDVVSGEAGGITQHIGAHRVKAGGREITFLDTPGHEAFTSMRARGANITDIAILVVAADDGIMPQTIESINHAKAAEVSIIVAINKMDKEAANPSRIKQELTEHGLLIEEWGGDVICCEVSAKQKTGIDNLLEMINLTAEVLELKSNPERLAVGTVIEARLDKGRGPVATLLVQKGTLNTGDVLIAGTAVGRIRVMLDDKGKTVKTAGPSVPVEITGLAEVPSAGDQFSAVADERLARELVEKRKHEAKEAHFSQYKKVTLDSLFSHIEQGSVKELPIIVKADVQGSVEAVKQSLEKLSNEEVKIRVIHGGVGAVSESDVMLANASGAIIVGFNVRPHPAAAENAKRDNVEIRVYRIIYDAIEEIQTAMKGMLAPKFIENLMARVEVRNVFKITGSGIVAGCYVLDGKVTRNCEIRIVRDGIIIFDDKINTLKRFKDDVKEVAAGYECGISLEKFSDIKEGDIFEAYIMEEVKQ
ncbi:MAG: translation initiation factor IF-2 [Oscillospiraceae bacterium]|nr:translation initiation factor IF-2 [Oscillospiraceae bacterium]